jgi:hypothetical protein
MEGGMEAEQTLGIVDPEAVSVEEATGAGVGDA